MSTMNISLPEQMKNWVESQANNGRYSNSSDYIRDLIRHDQNQKASQQALIQALIEGENSGDSEKTLDEIWASVKNKYNHE